VAFLALALGRAAAAVPGRPVRAAEPLPVATEAPAALPPAPTPVLAAASASPASLADQFDEMANDLDELASEAEERELDAHWHQRLAALRSRLQELQSSYALLKELAQKLPDPPETESESITDP
jgi:hypothetical protein